MFGHLKCFIENLSDRINDIAKIVVIGLVAVLTSIVLLQVIFRYILNIGLPWVDELSRYLNIWVAFLGASVGLKYGDHVGVSFFVNLLPEKLSEAFKLFTDIIIFIFLCVVIYYAYDYIITSRSVTPTMQISFKLPKSAIFAGTSIMVVHILNFIFNDLSLLFNNKVETKTDVREG
ncbi:TRAP transporter small permease [Halocella sp. SP3-1]|uniref:TRAP transporter small permease n=1 Tax=Halocella sp. SP3-1 TaxID=2382161 RepID=UPI000F74F5DD|nr:TRAP transporter small permease [Halocella sp. SP3-1]AZO94364.1 TRAP transporter small permease [Halocella sp. SP3-1]